MRLQYKDAPTKVKKPSSAHPPSTRQRPESTPNSTHDDRVESPAPGSGIDVGTPGSTSSGTGRTSTITEHHQVGVHEVTIKKVVFPASSDAPKGSTISAHGKISTDASSDAEKQGDDGKAGSEAAGEATESSGTGYFHRGGPTYRGGNFPPPPPTNTRGRSFGQNAVALAAAAAAQANNRSNAGFPIVRRGQNYQSGGQEGNKPGSGSLQPPQQGKESRRATSLPPRPATGGATAPPNAATQTKPSSGSVQSMTPGRRTSGNPGGFGGRFYGNASGSAPSSPPGGSGGNMQYYGGSGYNNYYYGQYGYGYNYYGQGDAAGSSMTYLADPSWYPTSSLTVPVVLGFLKAQVEWYFSVDNLVKDLFLRRQMDESGWIEAKVIGGFRRIVGWRDHLATLEGKERGDEEWLVDKLVESVEGTEVLEVVARSADGPAKFRKKEDWSIWLLPKQNDSSPSAVSAKVESSVSPATQSVADSEAKADNKPAEVAEPIATGAEQQSSNESISAETSTPVPTEDPVAVVNVEEAEAQVLVEEVAFVAQDGQATIAQGAREEPARIVEELLQDAAIEDGKGLVDHDQSDSAERIKDGQSPTMDKPAEVAAAAAEPAPTSGPAAKSSWAAAVGGKTVAAEVAAAVATTATEAELPKVSRVASWADEPERQRAPAAAAVTTSDASASPRDTEGGNEEPAQQDEDEGWTTVNTKKTKKVEKPSSSAFRGKRSNGNGGKRGTGNRTSGSAQREGGSGEDEEKSDWRKRNGSRNKQQRSPRPSPSEATAVTSEPNGEAQES